MALNQHLPLSPHLQIYTLPLTGIISITHRMTGVCLSIGLIAIVYFLVSLASGAADFASLQIILNGWLCKLIYWGFLFGLSFHLCHGLRHLVWDAGSGFEKSAMNVLVAIELAGTHFIFLTFLFLL